MINGVAVRSGRASVDVIADVSRFAAQLNRDLRAVLRGVKLDLSPVRDQVTRAFTKIIEGLPRDAVVEVDVDTGRVRPAARHIEGTLTRVAKVMASRFVIMGSLISSALLVATPAAVQLVAALAPAAGIMAALPALALSFAAALGVLKLGLVGVSDAIEAAFGDDAAKTAEALKKLAPSARQFVKELAAMKPALTGLQLDVQQRLFAGWAGELRATAALVLPVLRAQLPPIASGLSGMGSAFGAAVREGRLMGDVRTLLSTLPPALDVLATAVRPVVDGFGALAGAGSAMTLRLGTAIADLGQRFGQWATEAADSGAVMDWINEAITTLRTLGGIVGNIGQIFQRVFAAAGVDGNTLLDTLLNATAAAVEFLDSAQGFAGLTGLFSTLGTVSSAVLGALGVLLPEIARALAGAGPGLRDLSVAVTGLLSSVGPLLPPLGQLAGILAGTLGQVLIALTPAVQAVAGALAAILGPIASSKAAVLTLAAAWAAWRLTILLTSASAIPSAISAFAALAASQGVAAAASTTLATAARAAWLAIGGPIGAVVIAIGLVVTAFVLAYQKSQTFRAIVDGALRAVGDAALWLWHQAIKPAFAAIVVALRWVGDGLAWLWNNIGRPYLTALGAAALWLWNNALSPALTAIGAAIRTVGAVIGWWWTNVTQPTFTAIAAAATWLWTNVFSPAFTGIGILVRALGATVAWLWSVFAPPIQAVGALVFWLWRTVFSVAFDAIAAAVRGLAAVIGWWWTNVTRPTFSAIAAAATWLWSNAIAPAFDAIMSKLRAAGAVAMWLWNNAIGPALRAAGAVVMWLWSSVVVPAFNAIVSVVRSRIAQVVAAAAGIRRFVSSVSANFTSAVNAVRSRLASAVSLVRGLPGRIVSALGNLGRLLYGAGRRIIDGLINGISSRIAALRDKIAQAAAAIRDALPFSPAREGPLSGRGDPTIAGAKIGAMIADGIRSQTGTVRAAAQAIAGATRPAGLDVHGGRILSDALAGRRLSGTAEGAGVRVVFEAGAITVTFSGAVPSEAEARRVGQAIGQGIASTTARSNLATQIRTM